MKNGLTYDPVIGYQSRTETEKLEYPVSVKASSGLENFEPLTLLLLGVLIFVVYWISKKSAVQKHETTKSTKVNDSNKPTKELKADQKTLAPEHSTTSKQARTLMEMVDDTLRMQVSLISEEKKQEIGLSLIHI